MTVTLRHASLPPRSTDGSTVPNRSRFFGAFGLVSNSGQSATQAIKQPGVFQVVDEERQLPEWRDRRGRVPLNVDPAGEGVRYR